MKITHLIKREKTVADDTKTTIYVFRELCKKGMPLCIVYDKKAKNYLTIATLSGAVKWERNEHGHTVFTWISEEENANDDARELSAASQD